MAILTLQKRSRELGRIRMGQFVRPSGGKGRPEKLDRYRFTSLSGPLLAKVAALYGGEVQPWVPQGGGAEGYEVIVTSERIPILVPPQSVTQYYELWSGGGCVRRCDGQTELMSGGQCVCGIDPEDRDCKPTTRLNVVLRDVEGIGVWRLETHGWYAATELPEVADFLGQVGGYVSAFLGLEERVIKREGRTRRFMVPTIEVDVTPAQLLSGSVQAVQLGGRAEAPALPAGAHSAVLGDLQPQDNYCAHGRIGSCEECGRVRPLPVIEGGTHTGPDGHPAPISAERMQRWQPGDPVPPGYHEDYAEQLVPTIEPDAPKLDVDSVRRAIAHVNTVADLFAIKDKIVAAGLGPVARERQNAIEQAERVAAANAAGDVDALWNAIMIAVPDEWGTQQVDDDFERVTGVDPAKAEASHMQAYLAHLATTGQE